MEVFDFLLSHTSPALLLLSVSYCGEAMLRFVSRWRFLSHCKGSQTSSVSLCWCCFPKHRNSSQTAIPTEIMYAIVETTCKIGGPLSHTCSTASSTATCSGTRLLLGCTVLTDDVKTGSKLVWVIKMKLRELDSYFREHKSFIRRPQP